MRHTLILLAFLAVLAPAGAQNLWFNVDAGAANYDGELQQKRFTFNEAHPGGGLGLGLEVSPHVMLSTGFLYTEISGADKYSTNPGTRARNLSFATDIFEWNLRVDYTLFDLEDRPLSPYIFGGLAVFHFNPYAYDATGTKVYLRPLGTEGEGLDGNPTYSLTQPAIPVGFGLRLALSPNVRVGLEVGIRKTFTGYLDDVHGSYFDEATLLADKGPEAVEMAFRENELPEHAGANYPAAGFHRGTGGDDWYYFTGLRISFRIGGDRYIRNMHMDCPPVPR